MQNRSFVLTVAFALLPFATVSAAEIPMRPAVVPDRADAQVDGRMAVGFWARRDGKLLDPSSFTVHLVSESSLEHDLTAPAGHWLLPPPGKYKVWLESEKLISPTFELLTFADQPFRGSGIAAEIEVVPAGSVLVDTEIELGAGLALRLLHLDAEWDGRMTRGFMRSVTENPGDTPVRMPQGPVAAFLFDRRLGEYIAMTRPFDLKPGKPVRAHPQREEGVTHLFAILRRPKPLAASAEADLAMTLKTAGRPSSRPADVKVETWEWVYALWYDIPSKATSIEATSATAVLRPAKLTLQGSGPVITFRADLEPTMELNASAAPSPASESWSPRAPPSSPPATSPATPSRPTPTPSTSSATPTPLS